MTIPISQLVALQDRLSDLTYEEAHARLLKLAEGAVRCAEAELQDARRDLERIQALRPPAKP
jgi:Tfp pilus assembly protein PilX